MTNIPPLLEKTADGASPRPNGSGGRSGSRLCRYCSRAMLRLDEILPQLVTLFLFSRRVRSGYNSVVSQVFWRFVASYAAELVSSPFLLWALGALVALVRQRRER